jgi:hypothetical protein
MKLFKLIVITALFCGIHGVVMASPFSITCQTFNATTLAPQSVFVPGQKVLIVVTPTFSNAAAQNQTMTLTLQAKATVAGITIPYTISNAGSLKNSNPTSPGSPALLTNKQRTKTFKIPHNLPPSSLVISAVAVIQNLGTAAASTRIIVE